MPLVTVVIVRIWEPQGLKACGSSKFQTSSQRAVRFCGHATLSGALMPVTVCTQVTRFSQWSTTCQVRVAVKLPQDVALVIVLTISRRRVGSVTTGGSKFQAAPHSTVLFGAQ